MDLSTRAEPGRFYDGGIPDRDGVPLPSDPPTPGSPERVILIRRFRSGKEDFRLQRRIAYDDRVFGEILVPNLLDDFETDLTSVPGYFTWLVPKSGQHLPAALIHDGLIPDKGRPKGYRRTRPDEEEEDIDRIDADRVFRDAMHDTGVGLVRRWLVWAAVANASLCSGARAEWAAWKKWWFRGVVLATLGLIAYLGLAATLDVVNATSLPKGFGWLLGWPLMGDLPWIDDDAAFWKATGQGLAAAIVVPLVLGCLWGRHYRAGAVAGVALATLIHVTVAVVAVAVFYQGAEWVARRRQARVVVGAAILVAAATVFVLSMRG
jgi:hypothetical protein